MIRLSTSFSVLAGAAVGHAIYLAFVGPRVETWDTALAGGVVCAVSAAVARVVDR